MAGYLARRLLLYIPVLFLVTVFVFALALLTPGDPLDSLNDPDLGLSQEDVQALREKLGLTQPAPVRYLRWLEQVVQGDFGQRLKNGEPIGPLLATRLQRTLLLSGLATLVAIVVGLSLGIYTALHQYSKLDHLLTAFALVVVAMPAFFVAILGLWVFALTLNWFPVGGMTTPGSDPSDVGDFLRHLILPVLVLSAAQTTDFFRYMRLSMLEALRAEYVTAARARGLAERRVILVHALRNALLPVVTVVGLRLPYLVGGAVFVETLFTWPGMGMLFVDGVSSRDYPLIMAMTLVLACTILSANLLTDLAYSLVDPRIRLEG